MSVTVFGSINMDLVARTPHLPLPGETVTGRAFFTVPGGKGANQAVACARLGVPARMVGRVGGDEFGRSLLESLRQSAVDTTGVTVDESVSSGIALITVDDEAENSIVIIPGANGHIGGEDLHRLKAALPETEVLLLQLEVPLEAVLGAATLSERHRVPVVLDPAPARPLPSELYSLVDILTPNMTEAAALVGFPVLDEGSVVAAARVLTARGCKRVIVKMGPLGAYAADADAGRFYPAIPVQAVDTTAAGDAFNGALAAALAEGRPFEEAMGWALAAGACAAAREGAQPSMPGREALLKLLDRSGEVLRRSSTPSS